MKNAWDECFAAGAWPEKPRQTDTAGVSERHRLPRVSHNSPSQKAGQASKNENLMNQDDNLSADEPRLPAIDDGNVTTGVAGLDDILGGGLVEGGLYLIEGMAGAGKTILSSQIGFHRVAQGDMVLYITLIAESHTKLLSHLRGLSFYNADAISDRM
ncbi:MAG TPA: ATPase domain-containing protein, partial [Xanthobacteraceae bacterium]